MADEQHTYLDFELRIGGSTDDRYVIEVIHSPAGETHAMQALLVFHELLAVEHDAIDVKTSESFGLALFDALFCGEIRNRYDISQQIAKDQGKGLRLKLRIDPPEQQPFPGNSSLTRAQRNISVCRAIRRLYTIWISRNRCNRCWSRHRCEFWG